MSATAHDVAPRAPSTHASGLVGPARHLVSAGYGVGLILLVAPLLEIAVLSFPYQPGKVLWRFGAAGLLSNAAGLLTLGFGVLLFVAAAGGNRRLLRGLSVVVGLVSLGVVALAVGFALDGLQLRGSVNVDAAGPYRAVLWKTEIVFVMVALVTAWLAVGGWRASAPRPKTARTSQREERGTAHDPGEALPPGGRERLVLR